MFVLEFPLIFYYFLVSLEPELLCTLPESPHDLMFEFVAEMRQGELDELRCLLILCICFCISALSFLVGGVPSALVALAAPRWPSNTSSVYAVTDVTLTYY